MGATDVFPLTPDYAITEQFDDGMLRSASMGGKAFLRLVRPPRRSFHLVFKGRPTTDKETLLQWYREFEATYFRFDHSSYLFKTNAYVSRSFPVHFAGPPKFDFVANECNDMECDLIEAVGCDLATSYWPTVAAGHPTATIPGVTSGADQIFVYGGYGFYYTGTGTLTLDGTAATSPKTDVALGLHRLYVTAGTGTLEVII